MRDLLVDVSAVALCGAVGGFVNVFIGDSGLHLPRREDGIWRPGYLGVVFVGIAAAVAGWLTTQSASLMDALRSPVVTLRLSELGAAIAVGFGGGRWFKAEGETTVLRRTATIAAAKAADETAAAKIASSPPFEALATAIRMR